MATFHDLVEGARQILTIVSMLMVLRCLFQKDSDGQVKFMLWAILLSL